MSAGGIVSVSGVAVSVGGDGRRGEEEMVEEECGGRAADPMSAFSAFYSTIHRRLCANSIAIMGVCVARRAPPSLRDMSRPFLPV